MAQEYLLIVPRQSPFAFNPPCVSLISGQQDVANLSRSLLLFKVFTQLDSCLRPYYNQGFLHWGYRFAMLIKNRWFKGA
ncbi:hypothetical protein ACA29_18540 [Lederbergia galactosidilytica]|uniref:Uncharacterized protein n=1 Tax=Lederbergia galactosidilytica TaxID=217031 RepID=A0A0Q9Y5T0_9BACI|nr:hypothetical protein ACA29_18540 [Lederbergia galactosidilytica]